MHNLIAKEIAASYEGEMLNDRMITIDFGVFVLNVVFDLYVDHEETTGCEHFFGAEVLSYPISCSLNVHSICATDCDGVSHCFSFDNEAIEKEVFKHIR